MTPFLDCNIWSVSCNGIDQYFFVEKVYHYTSLTEQFIDVIPGHTQIPEFEIGNLSLLQKVNFDIVNEHRIPIIKINDDDSWSIDLKYYEEHYSNL